MKKILIIAAFAAALTAGACTQVRDFFGGSEISNPIAASTRPDTRVLAAYGLVTIALEEAAVIAENPATPDEAVQALARVGLVMKETADVARVAAIEYREAADIYESARAAGAPNQAALLSVVVSRGIRAQEIAAELQRQVAEMRQAFDQANADDTTLRQTEDILATAQAGFAAATE